MAFTLFRRRSVVEVDSCSACDAKDRTISLLQDEVEYLRDELKRSRDEHLALQAHILKRTGVIREESPPGPQRELQPIQQRKNPRSEIAKIQAELDTRYRNRIVAESKPAEAAPATESPTQDSDV